ncbi:MAG: molybdopterin-dependent oxidoreductase, partial [Saprospiraceae bacterium]|nr:molybdopterin-dependent oxidoreductase [Saprospiraceae bacterium]
MTKLIGQSVKRVEDKRFITGQGQYTDDIVLPGMTYAYILRSPYAHATIKSIDTAAARAMEGVVAVFTGEDIAKAGINGVPTGWQVNFKSGETMKEPPHPLLVADRVKHVGDSLAVVIAESREIAKDAADLIEIDYDVLEAVWNPADAIAADAPQVHEGAPNNICFDWELGNPKAEVDAALAGAHHVTSLDLVNQRMIPNPIEPRSAIGHFESSHDRYTLYTT